MVEAILGELPAESWAEVRSHIGAKYFANPGDGESPQESSAGCVVCAEEWQELHAAWEVLGTAAGSVAPPEAVREELLRRVGEAQAEQQTQPSHGERETVESTPVAVGAHSKFGSRNFTYAALTLAATILGAVVTIAMQDRGEHRAEDSLASDRLAAQQQLSQTLEAALAKSQTDDSERFAVYQTTFLTGTGESPDDPQTVLLWDRESGQLHFYASNLPPLSSEQGSYGVWLEDRNERQHFVGRLRLSEFNHQLLANAPIDYEQAVSLFVAASNSGEEPVLNSDSSNSDAKILTVALTSDAPNQTQE